MDADYDEFGNYIGGELSDSSEEVSSLRETCGRLSHVRACLVGPCILLPPPTERAREKKKKRRASSLRCHTLV